MRLLITLLATAMMVVLILAGLYGFTLVAPFITDEIAYRIIMGFASAVLVIIVLLGLHDQTSFFDVFYEGRTVEEYATQIVGTARRTDCTGCGAARTSHGRCQYCMREYLNE